MVRKSFEKRQKRPKNTSFCESIARGTVEAGTSPLLLVGGCSQLRPCSPRLFRTPRIPGWAWLELAARHIYMYGCFLRNNRFNGFFFNINSWKFLRLTNFILNSGFNILSHSAIFPSLAIPTGKKVGRFNMKKY